METIFTHTKIEDLTVKKFLQNVFPGLKVFKYDISNDLEPEKGFDKENVVVLMILHEIGIHNKEYRILVVCKALNNYMKSGFMVQGVLHLRKKFKYSDEEPIQQKEKES